MNSLLSRPALGLVILLLTSRELRAGSDSVGPASREVQLRCQIAPSGRLSELEMLLVSLYKSNGAPAREQVTTAGSSVHFKHLPQDIYNVCLEGAQGRRSCQSVDLVLPSAPKTTHFVKTLFPPASRPSSPDAYLVSASQLEIPEQARKELLVSVEALKNGDEDGELAHLQRALTMAPSFGDALNNIGAHWIRTGKPELALPYLLRVVDLQPGFYFAWVNLGKSYVASGQLPKALGCFVRALALEPDNADVNASVGLAYYHLRDWNQAKRYFKKVLQLDRVSARAPQLYLMRIALIESRPEDAASYIRDYLEVHPNCPNAEKLRQVMIEVLKDRIASVDAELRIAGQK